MPSALGDRSPDELDAQRRSYRWQLRAVWLIALVAAVVATFAPGAPTGLVVADAIWKGLFAATLVVAAAFAHRSTWVVVTGVAAVAAVGEPAAAALGVGALLVAILGATMRRRSSVAGAVAVAIAAQVLLRLPELGFVGANALVAAFAWLVICVSAYTRVGRPTRTWIRRVVLGVVVVVVIVLIPIGYSARVTFQKSAHAVTESNAWLEAARDADQPAVTKHLDAARESFESIDRATASWWNLPARALPIVGPQLRTVNLVATSGTEVSLAASRASTVATIDDLRFEAGQIDLQKVDALREPLRDASREVEATAAALQENDDTWLIPPLRRRVADFNEQIVDAADETALASEVLSVAPALLGADGPRTYMVLFTSPSESRELGGFMGNIGLLNVDQGRITLEEVFRTRELNQRTYELPDDRLAEIASHGYPERYLRYEPWIWWQNLTGTPDLPTVGRMAQELAPHAIGRQIDGVMAIDPIGLAALLRVAGDVEVNDLDVPIGPDNAADFLLRDQYRQFPEVDERKDFLQRIAKQTFTRLTRVKLPGPRFIGESLGPAVGAGHLRVWMSDPDEQAFFEQIGASDHLERSATGDDLLVTISNANANKADAYMQRSVTYDMTYDSTTGEADGTITVDLQNDVPLDLTDYVVANINDEPRGTNRTFLSVYSGLTIDSATIDGEDLPLEVHDEYGLRRGAAFVSVPPGGRRQVVLRVSGPVKADGTFDLRVITPALVNPDHVQVTVHTATGGDPPTLAGSPTMTGTFAEGSATTGEGTASFDLVGKAWLSFPLPAAPDPAPG